ncbi:hypothetical protein DdX_07403 [Ditylenchus destructor]|uniref:Uncharacterized protein n=1 Tax=Ditylenchus destructor TaxID=166010 RepID=A0AAD4R1U2_9BILA|nr:hypothetical protein DdX_07403 [Ditylenchus destructor]
MVSTSSKADTSTTVDDWFDNVENIKPLRGGRKGDTLNEVSRCTNKYSAEQAEEKFRTELENARKTEDDPLSVSDLRDS